MTAPANDPALVASAIEAEDNEVIAFLRQRNVTLHVALRKANDELTRLRERVDDLAQRLEAPQPEE